MPREPIYKDIMHFEPPYSLISSLNLYCTNMKIEESDDEDEQMASALKHHAY